MENEEKNQNSKMDLDIPNHKSPSSSNNLMNSKNNQSGENNSNTQLKKGQFMLTPLEGLLLNKKMPYGFKFETEDNISKTLELSKIKHKRLKHGGVFGDAQKRAKTIKNSTNDSKNNNFNKEHLSNNNKITKKVAEKELIININNKSEQYKVMNKCFSGFNKIKSNPNSSFFYSSKFPDSPSLSNIEKKIKNLEYITVNDFCDDLRKLWNFQFKNYAKEPNIYQNICKMSLLSDQVCKELLNENLNNNKNEEISTIRKKTEKIKKEMNEAKDNKNQSESVNKKRNLEEINHLGQLIRTLNKEQLKGIIPILSDKNENNNSKMFEFDLEQLPFDKFKKLEDYVLNCINKNKNPSKSLNGINKEINKTIKNISEPKDKLEIKKNNNNINGTNINRNAKQNEKNINTQSKNYEKIQNNINNNIQPNLINKDKSKETRNEDLKKADKIEEIKNNNLNDNLSKNQKQNNMEEINYLGQLIRTLNKQQLKGIIPILSDKNENNNSKMFEFNLEQLSFEKFKELKGYVFNCININKNTNNNNSNNKNMSNKETDKNENKNNINNDSDTNKKNNNKYDKNLNTKENIDIKNQSSKKNNSFSDSDSLSSYSSLSN